MPGPAVSHKPLDLVVLMLGTNDLKSVVDLAADTIAAGAGALVKMILESESGPEAQAPRVLLLCPGLLGEMAHLPEWDAKFAGAHEKAKRFPGLCEAIARQHGCAYFDVQPLMTPSALDGLHFEAAEHARLGTALAEVVRGLLVRPGSFS